MATIGNTSAGASTRTFNSNIKGILISSFPEAATANSITGYFAAISGQSYQAVIVSQADYNTILASSSLRTDCSGTDWFTFNGGTLAGYSLAASTAYLICIATTNGASGLFYYGAYTYDGVTGLSGVNGIDPVTFPVNPGVGDDATRDYSIYLDYTAGSGGGFVGWGPRIAGLRNRRVIAA
jgi:hypothetical protein